MNLIYDDFPETVCIDGKEYEVITDFREWVRFADTAAADELTEEEKLCIFMLYFTKEKPKDFSKALKALIDFYGCADVPKPEEKAAGKAVFPHLCFRTHMTQDMLLRHLGKCME